MTAQSTGRGGTSGARAGTAAPAESTEEDLGGTERFCAALFAGASPEFRVVAACCLRGEDAGRAKVLKILSEETAQVHWPQVWRAAERHRVSGLVARVLRDVPDVPAEIAAKFRDRAAQIQRENMAQVGMALRVGRALEARGIAYLVLKGAPLSQLAYGTTSVRHMRDIDLLVATRDTAVAERELPELGFEREADHGAGLTARQAAMWKRFRKHHEFVHRATGVRLELHWRAFDNARLGAIPVDRTQWLEVSGGQELPTLPTPELLLLLCGHGAGHAWFRLKWIADIAALLEGMTHGQRRQVWQAAKERDLDRPVEQAFLLCSGLFGVEFAPQRSSRVGRWLAEVARDALLTEVAKGKSSESDFVPRRLTASRFLLRRSWRYRLEEARVNAASPADWGTLPVPDSMLFVYPLLRVPLWVRRRWFARPRA